MIKAEEFLYDHYKETLSLNKEAQIRRNKSFIILCVLEALSFLILIRPEKVFDLILEGINSGLEMTLVIGNTILQTLLWLLIAYVMIRYIQDMLYIERQYNYLDTLEKEISKVLKVDIFAREGTNYQRNYPIVLNFIDLFYKMLIPIFFILVNTIHIGREWALLNKVTLALICDTVLYVVIFIITWFYFFEIHSKITEFFKVHLPFIDRIACALRKVLKEV